MIRFLWVTLQLQNLCSLRLHVEEDLLAELGRLPEDLADTYAQVFEHVGRLAPQSRVIAERSLKWLLCQAGEFSEAEFLAAVSIGTERESFNLTKETILFICGNLVMFDQELEVFRFAHLSVREYLETQPNFTLSVAHALGAEISLLICLQRYTELTAECARTFRPYAFVYWLYHCREAKKPGMGSLLYQLLEDFLHVQEGTNLCYAEWARYMHRLRSVDRSIDLPYYVEGRTDLNPWEYSILDSILDDQDFPYGTNFLNERTEDLILDFILGDRDYPSDPTFVACFLDLPEIVEQNLRSVLSSSAKKVGVLASDNIKALEWRNMYGATYLHVACHRGSSKLLRLILQYPVDVRAIDKLSRTALHYAIGPRGLVSFQPGGWTETVRNAHDPANAAERIAMIGLLLEKGSIIDAIDYIGETALHRASHANFCTQARSLLEHGAFVDARTGGGRTPLHLAVENGNTAVAQLLLRYKANVEARDSNRMTPLLLAARLGHTAVTQLLLQSKADIEARDSDKRTPMFQTVMERHIDTGRLLLRLGADINAKDEHGKTPLARSLLMRHEAIAQMLIDEGASIKEVDLSGNTVLHYAAGSRLGATVSRLLQMGACNSEINVHGYTPLHVAIDPTCALPYEGREIDEGFHTVELLLDVGANIEMSDNRGRTPLHLAARMADEASIQILLSRGANIKAEDRKGLLPLDHAAFSGSLQVFSILFKPWADVMAESSGNAVEPWLHLVTKPMIEGSLGMLQAWRAMSLEELIELTTPGSKFQEIWAESGPTGFGSWYRAKVLVREMRARRGRQQVI